MGLHCNQPINEGVQYSPETMYHATKAAQEFILNQLVKLGTKVCSLRLPSPIGPRQPEKTIVPIFVTACDEYSGIDFAFLGHTHHQIIKYTHGCTIVNPGSAGQQRDGKGCKYVLFDTSTRQIAFKVIEYNKDSLVDDINRNDSGKMKEKLIEVLYRSSAIPHSN